MSGDLGDPNPDPVSSVSGSVSGSGSLVSGSGLPISGSSLPNSGPALPLTHAGSLLSGHDVSFVDQARSTRAQFPPTRATPIPATLDAPPGEESFGLWSHLPPWGQVSHIAFSYVDSFPSL